MRLTLRTLIAYIDDVLKPAQAKEIGARVRESPIATALVRRIKEVSRKRRIKSLDVLTTHPLDDANVTAEYLNDVLPSDKVVMFEQKCLESDDHLAEVVGCHQILVHALAENVEIKQSTKERVYDVIDRRLAALNIDFDVPRKSEPKPAAAVPPASHPVAKAASSPTPAAIAPPRAPEPTPVREEESFTGFEDGIPDYLKSTPLWKKAWPTALAVLAFGIWLAVFMTDSSLTGTGGPSENSLAEAETSEAEQADAAAAETTDAESKPSKQAEESKLVGDATGAKTTSDAANTSKADTTVAMNETTQTTGNDVEDPSTMIAGPDANTTTEDEQPDVPEPPPVQIAGPLSYTPDNGVLLLLDIDGLEWNMVNEPRDIAPGRTIACVEPFRVRLDPPSESMKVILAGNVRGQVIGTTTAAKYGFRLERGRMILQSVASEGPPEPKPREPELFELGVQADRWTLELLQPGTQVGIEVLPRLPQHFEEEFGNETHLATLIVAKGDVQLKDSDGKERVLAQGQSVNLMGSPDWFEGYHTEQEKADPLGLTTEQTWITEDPGRKSLTERRNALAFYKEFDSTQPVALTVPSMVKNPNYRVSEFAVMTLATTNRYQELAQVLKNAPHAESKAAAIEGLREWLPTNPRNRTLLTKALAKVFQPDTAALVYALLWGYNMEDAKNEQLSLQLVEMLRHEDVAVRNLAIYNIYRLTGRTYDYRPLNPISQRESSVNRWLMHVEREGALISPAS